MCGRFAISDETNELLEEIVEQHGIRALQHWRDYLPAYNIKPTQQVPVILHSKREGADVIAAARWSLVPPWSKELASRFPTFNARSEGITEKATWKGPVKSSRCLIPASGYFEWTGEKPPKTPHWLHPIDRPMLMFAGLYSWWADPSLPAADDARWHLTATILTMSTVPELAAIHDRNPVGLPEAMWWDWIDPEQTGDQAFVDAAVVESRPVMAGLAEYVVAPLRGDGPGLIEPV